MKVATIEKFEKLVRERLKKREEKIYLKQNYSYDIFQRHGISDEEINFLFNPKKIIRIYPNLAFPEERVDVEINATKRRKIKVILLFDPIHNGEKLIGKIGVITAFKI